MWKYYNGAIIPNCAPHEEVDTDKIKNGEIWKEFSNRKPYFVRWTTDFDCDIETQWWYVIKNKPFSFEELEPKKKKHIRQALKKCQVKELVALDYKEQLYKVYKQACEGYKNFSAINKEDFFINVQRCVENKIEYWGAFNSNDEMIGWMSIKNNGDWAHILSAKFSPGYLNLRPSDAIYYTILQYYLNDIGVDYISSGERSISHITNTQEYKIKTFKFRKAYCKLHLQYNPKYKRIISILYPFRKILNKIESINFIRKISSVLKMEEIVRNQNKNEKQ